MNLKSLYTITPEIIGGEAGKLQYTAYCPIITKPENRATQTINNFSRHACGEFIKYACELGREICEESSVTRCYQLMFSSRFLISFKYEMRMFDEKKEPFIFAAGSVWNTSCGSAAGLKEFFRGNVRYREMILYILSGKIKEKEASGEKLCPDWHSRLYAAWKNMGYYLCKEGFVFLLPPKTIKAEETRTSEILVTFAEIKNQLGGRLLT